MKQPSRSYVKSAILILAAAVVVAAAWGMYRHASLPAANPAAGLQKESASVLSPQQYRSEAQAAGRDYDDFLNGKAAIDAVRSRRSQLLILKVSAADKDLHLKLVMLADALELANSAPESKARARSEWQEILKMYPWIKE